MRLSKNERTGKVISIKDILSGIIKQCNLKNDFSIEYIRRSWRDVAGDLAAQSRPEKIDRDVLFVSSSHPIISNELVMMKSAIISRFNEKFHAGIKDMKFIHGGKI